MNQNTKPTRYSRRANVALSTAIEILEPRIAPATLVGLTNKDVLVTFDSGSPGKILSAAKVTGLETGENVISIDARPANGLIYGLTNRNTLYILNPYTGIAELVGSGVADFPITGKSVGIDFNPTVDRIRAVTDADLNYRLNPNTGALVDGDGVLAGVQPDTALAYDAADPNAEKNPFVTAVAYDRNFQGTTLATLFGIDSTRNSLVRIGGVDGTPSPNAGTLTTVGALGVNPGARVGFDIAADGTPYAAMQVGGKTTLYTIDLVSGHASSLGRIGNGRIALDAITTVPNDEIVVGVTTSNRLVTFRADNPGQLLTSVPLTNLSAGETIAGIDFRPGTGELHAITSTNRILFIDQFTGQTIQRGATLDPALFAASPNAGFDFNPSVDRIRIVNPSDQNLRFNPVSYTPVDGDLGTVGTQGDTALVFAAGDANVGANPNITGVAYDRNDVDGTTPTTLFGIDSTLNILVRQGGPDGNPSPNLGGLNTVGQLGVDPTSQVGFDISNSGRLGSGVALAVMQLNGESTSKLFAINLNEGLTNQPAGGATLIGTIGSGEALTAMAIAPASVQFTVTNTIVKEKAGTFAVIEISRTGGHGSTATVQFNTMLGTATAGLDYTAFTNELVSFARGETLKKVMIPIIRDTIVEPNETIGLQLSSAGGGTTVLGRTINALVTIQGKKVSL